MNNKKISIISFICFIIGIIFFMYQKELIVFRFPKFKKNEFEEREEKHHSKKNVKLFFWQNSKWKHENLDILWSEDDIENLSQIITNWLNVVDEEKVIDQKVSLQQVLNSLNSQDVYVSFDQNLFNEESSTYCKLMIIESLLKTIRENEISINKIHFLVHNQQIKDSHLDFSNGWPLSGFIKNN